MHLEHSEIVSSAARQQPYLVAAGALLASGASSKRVLQGGVCAAAGSLLGFGLYWAQCQRLFENHVHDIYNTGYVRGAESAALKAHYIYNGNGQQANRIVNSMTWDDSLE